MTRQTGNRSRPARRDLVTLRARASDAADELAALASGDPAAAPALRSVRLAEYILRDCWLPALDDLLDG